MKNTMRRRAATIACAVAIALAPVAAMANDDAVAKEGGMGALAAIGTLVYGPVKIVYAVLGLVFGGAAWGLSGGDEEVLAMVITPSVRGDYVLTPEHLRRERDLEFFGRDPAYRESRHAQLTEDY